MVTGAMASFMKSKLGPISKELQSIDDVTQFLNYKELIAIGNQPKTRMNVRY